MAIETQKIGEPQKAALLKLEEGHFADLKAREVKPGKLTEFISAFANADGGELFIGIDEDKLTQTRAWRGFDTEEEANGHLQIFEQLFPLGHGFEYTFLQSDGAAGFVLHVLILKSKTIVKASDGMPYLRRGAQKLPVNTPEALSRLKLDKGIESFETETCNVPVDVVSNSETIIEFLTQVVPTAEPSIWLKKQLLIREEKPTVAAVLLYSDEPQAALPKRCGIKVYRYKTKDAEGARATLDFDPISIEGPIYRQIKAAVDRVVQIIEGIAVLGEAGFQQITYPKEALHEIITNAVLHRDYSIVADIHVRIFDNRVEVESPGKLPGHVTLANILREQFARNGALVRLVNKFPDPPNKDVGEGLNTAFEAMRGLKLKEPIIHERENSLIVFLRHEPLASPEEIVAEYLRVNPEINNSKAREICHIGSENVMKRVFEGMMASKVIERVPGKQGRAIAYRLVQKPD
jgi:ATP-dependent DNA helicase RecG